MMCFEHEIKEIEKYYKSKFWDKVEIDKGDIYFKRGYILSNDDYVRNLAEKKHVYSFCDMYDSFINATEKFFQQKIPNLITLDPINIYNGYNKNSFVSTGLEYYYNYLYNNFDLGYNNTIIVQPSIRFKLSFFDSNLYGHNDKYDYSSISFNNISIVNKESSSDLLEKIEIMLDYLSLLKIHASRVHFIVEKDIKYKDNNVSYVAVKFFVDNLEVSDVLLFKTLKGYLTEFGFGFERLISRIVNEKYDKIFMQNSECNHEALLGINFFIALCMFDESNRNRGAKSKINGVVKKLEGNNDIMNINLIHMNYLYWRKILGNTIYQNDFDSVTNKYLSLVKGK